MRPNGPLRFLRNLSLHTTVLLLVMGTVSGLLLLILGSVLWVTRRESARSVERDFRATDTFLRQSLRDRTDFMLQTCQSLGSRPGVLVYLMAGAAKADWATVSDAAGDVQRQLDAHDVLITDRAGRAVGESPGDVRDRGVSLAALPGVAAALRGEDWKGVVAYKGRLTVAVATPIRTPGQPYVQGTVCAFADIGTLSQVVATALDCQMVFVDHGAIAGQSSPFGKLPPLPTVAEGDTALLPNVFTAAGGKRYLGSYQTLRLTGESPPVGVLILHPYDGATVLSRDLQAGMVGPFVLSLFLALLAGAGVARRVTGPLEGVVHAARELREGRWPRRFTVERGDEIGLLQTVFNEMTVAMQSSQERLLRLLDTDPLTGLDNHRRFQERLTQEMDRAAVSGEPLSLLLLDIDHFQAFNQRFGHGEGDETLKSIAAVIRAELPAFAVAARYGGEEFAVLAPRIDGGGAIRLAEQIRCGLAQSGCILTISSGFAERREGVAEPESLALAAELALTQAKQLGRNRVCGFDAVAGAVADSGLAALDPFHLHRFLRDGSLATIQALAAAVDAKDPYTQGHSRRVAELALRMARHCGLPPDDADLIYTTGTLHDVGKIGVPDRVLQKAERLDGEERQLMETHPVLGEVIVGKAPQLARTLPGVRSHHERWDGGGYPDGLAGEQIPLPARILALADTYDAMTSDRPYRKGLPPETALREISRFAGSQFDPELAPQFVQLMQESTVRRAMAA